MFRRDLCNQKLMDNALISTLSQLSDAQKTTLRNGSEIILRLNFAQCFTGNIQRMFDVILTPLGELARKCRVSPLEIKSIVDVILWSDLSNIKPLRQVVQQGGYICTTGDRLLDQALGGGIRTGTIWEVVGERSGKVHLFCSSVIH